MLLIFTSVSPLPLLYMFLLTPSDCLTNYNYSKDLFPENLHTRSIQFPEDNFFILDIKEINLYNPQMQRLLRLKW